MLLASPEHLALPQSGSNPGPDPGPEDLWQAASHRVGPAVFDPRAPLGQLTLLHHQRPRLAAPPPLLRLALERRAQRRSGLSEVRSKSRVGVRPRAEGQGRDPDQGWDEWSGPGTAPPSARGRSPTLSSALFPRQPASGRPPRSGPRAAQQSRPARQSRRRSAALVAPSPLPLGRRPEVVGSWALRLPAARATWGC